jgi:hypothetical protein
LKNGQFLNVSVIFQHLLSLSETHVVSYCSLILEIAGRFNVPSFSLSTIFYTPVHAQELLSEDPSKTNIVVLLNK